MSKAAYKDLYSSECFPTSAKGFLNTTRNYSSDSSETVFIIEDQLSGKKDYSSSHYLWNREGLDHTVFAYTINHLSQTKRMVNMQRVIQYFKDVAAENSYVWVHEDYLGEIPCIKNKRIPVSQIIASLSEGISMGKICSDFSVTEAEIQGAVSYVLDLLNTPFVKEYQDEDILG